MGNVRVLPEVLAHQIAAGEVVERPASVVKELVENSLDAGATRIETIVEEGGKRRIQVSDDGCGMSAADAEAAFAHHATSKIATLDDLTSIRTLGFRGEALPSIASVSRVRLRTRAADAEPGEAGTEIVVEGGRRHVLQPANWPAGTQVRVEDLFFNVPARKKFLKTDPTELSHISRQVTVYSLAFPDVEFQLRHGQRRLLEAPRVASLRDRVYQVLGGDLLDCLVDVDLDRDGVHVRGLTGLPHEQRSNSRTLFVFVNRRMVRDRLLVHAVRQAYRDVMPQASYPAAVLFVELDPSRLDVNVHPAKTEIRFRDPQGVHRAVVHALEEALHTGDKGLADIARDLPAGAWSRADPFNRFSGSGELWRAGQTEARGQDPGTRGAHGQASYPMSQSPYTPAVGATAVAEAPPTTTEGPHVGDLPDPSRVDPTPVVHGQLVESFIVATDREGVLLVDQHVAHERILYDRALAEMDSDAPVPVQQLLVPRTMEFDSQRLAVAQQAVESLEAGGFLVEPFGETTLMIRGIPAIAGSADAERVVEGVLEELERIDGSEADSEHTVARLRQKIAIGMACRAAIKINTPLSPEKMHWLLDALFATSDPYTCPHGRPIVLRLGLEEILKGFKRV